MRCSAVRVRIPGSTSNLGSGFDTLGLAVAVYNEVAVRRRRSSGMTVRCEMRGADSQKAWRLAVEAAALFFKRGEVREFGMEIRLSGEVPIGRGLGASATARAGVVAALNELCGTGLGREELLQIITELEGHPDNASPALFGGFTVSGRVGATIVCHRFPVAGGLKLVTLIPPFEVATEKARRLVPSSFSKADTAHALNRAALITAAFAKQEYERLRGVFDDRFHQPHRERLIPGLARVIQAGETAGALGGFLSGSGSAIICLCLKNEETVARAMQQAFGPSQVKIVTPENRGLRIMGVERRKS